MARQKKTGKKANGRNKACDSFKKLIRNKDFQYWIKYLLPILVQTLINYHHHL